MFKNFEKFTYSSEENFPKESCTIQNKRESNVRMLEENKAVLFETTEENEQKKIARLREYGKQINNKKSGYENREEKRKQ